MTGKRYDVNKIKITIGDQEITGFEIKTIQSFCGCCGIETTNNAFFYGTPRDPLCEDCSLVWDMPIKSRTDSPLLDEYLWFFKSLNKSMQNELFDDDCSLKEAEKLLENQMNETVKKGLFNASLTAGEED